MSTRPVFAAQRSMQSMGDKEKLQNKKRQSVRPAPTLPKVPSVVLTCTWSVSRETRRLSGIVIIRPDGYGCEWQKKGEDRGDGSIPM